MMLCGDCGELLLNKWVEPDNSCRTQVSIGLGGGTRLIGVQIPAPLISSCVILGKLTEPVFQFSHL